MSTITLHSFIRDEFTELVGRWQKRLQESWSANPKSFQLINLEHHCTSLLTCFNVYLEDITDNTHYEELTTLLAEVGAIWAKKGISASQASHFVITLKQTLVSQLRHLQDLSTTAMFELVQEAHERLDPLLIHCHEAYTASREKLIKQQSAALLDLSSPVVKMWDNTLLLPLIGVIDTRRAKQITESLLTEITQEEATVAVLDLTGVPVFDTAVAGHLIKTVNAAHMLGCKVIMTGISPEGALVLTKLGVEFKEVLTRGNLQSGVRSAFSLQGLAVTPAKAA